MKLRYGNFELANSALLEGAYGFTLNGQQINDRFDLYRADYAKFSPRGNRSYTLGFSVRPQKDTLRASARHALEQFKNLPQQADLYMYIGDDADGEWVRFADAVIDSVPAFFQGASPGFQYNFCVGQPLFDESQPDVTPPDDDIKRGLAAITSGAETIAVVFSTPFSGTPIVTATVQIPDSGDYMTCQILDSTVSAAGFTARLNGPTPGVGYKLSWMAIL